MAEVIMRIKEGWRERERLGGGEVKKGKGKEVVGERKSSKCYNILLS